MQRHWELVWKRPKRQNTYDSYKNALTIVFLQKVTVHRPEGHKLLGSHVLRLGGPVLALHLGRMISSGRPKLSKLQFNWREAPAWASAQVEGRLSRIMLDISFGTSGMLTTALSCFTATIAVTQANKTKTTRTATPFLCCHWYSDYHQKKGQKIWLCPSLFNVGTSPILNRWAILAKCSWFYAFLHYYYHDEVYFSKSVFTIQLMKWALGNNRKRQMLKTMTWVPIFDELQSPGLFIKNYYLFRMSKPRS